MNEPTPEQLARMVAEASDEQLAEGMAGENRKLVLDEVFRRMAEHVDPEAASDVEAVAHWRIGGRPDGGFDHYEVVVDKGRCETSDAPARDPDVTFEIHGVDFLRLVSGVAQGPMLFMIGKLKIRGDMMLATRMAGLFRIPRAA